MGNSADSEKIRIEKIRSLDALKPYADDWNRLASKAPQRTPMLSYAYVATYLEYFLEPRESWFCLLALQGDDLVGILPVVITPAKSAGLELPLLRAPFNMHIASVDFLTKDGTASNQAAGKQSCRERSF